MKKQMVKSAIISVIGMGFIVSAVNAAPLNSNRPYDSGNLGEGTNGFGEELLQTVFNNNITGGTVDTVADQSDAAIWTIAEGAVDAYLVSMLTGSEGTLGIYSFSTGAQYDLGVQGDTSVSFVINNSGALYIDNVETDVAFGDAFGFYFNNYDDFNYTEDSKNGGDIAALTYLLEDGLTVSTQAYGGLDVTTTGNNDWIIAFEDGGDNDFQDGVYLIEDINAVPEPTTMLLFGAGLAGLAGVARRRRK